ncbi:MAG: type IV pilin-like G/H family protein [Cyanobacteria bacterium P01_H01_bin.15]
MKLLVGASLSLLCLCTACAEAPDEQATQDYLERLVRSQIQYYVEQGEFTTRFDQLGVFPPEPSLHNYEISLREPQRLDFWAMPERSRTYGYIGTLGGGSAFAGLSALICQSQQPGVSQPPKVRLEKRQLICPTGYEEFSRLTQ